MIWKRIGFAVILLGITIGSLIPSTAVAAVNTLSLSDWILHGIGYLLLALFAAWAIPTAPKWAIFAAVFAYGALIEVAQTLVITRSFDVLDLASNAIGAALGVTIGALTTSRSRSPHR